MATELRTDFQSFCPHPAKPPTVGARSVACDSFRDPSRDPSHYAPSYSVVESIEAKERRVLAITILAGRFLNWEEVTVGGKFVSVLCVEECGDG